MRSACLIVVSALFGLALVTAHQARAAGQFSIGSTYPSNGAGNIPVDIINSSVHPAATAGYANQSVVLYLQNLPLTGCRVDASSVTATTSVLTSGAGDTQNYGLTSPAMGRGDSGWWLALSSPRHGFELLPHTTYKLTVAGGVQGLAITCPDGRYTLNQSQQIITFTTGEDTIAPTIMGPQVNASGTTADFSWETFQAASGRVRYGSSLESLVNHSGSSTLHRVRVSNLTPGKTYRYRIQSTDPSGNTGFSDGTFTTVGVGEIKIIDITDTAATIVWDTNLATDTLVELGTTSEYGDRQGNGAQVLHHNLRLTGLRSDTTYHFRIVATNRNGSTRFADNIFATKPLPPIAAGSTEGQSANGSDENIKLFPQVPLPPPLVLGASSAATAVSDGIEVGRNLLSKPVAEGWPSWLTMGAWLLLVILGVAIMLVAWQVKKDSTATRPPASQ